MALTRKMLKAMGIEDEKIDQIIEAHSETVDALKTQMEADKDAAKKLESVQKELDELKDTVKKDGEKNPWKVKYEAIKEEFDAYKSDSEKKAAHSEKEKAFRELLKESGVSEKYLDTVVRVSDIDSIELDENGKIKEADAKMKEIKEEWSDFISTNGVQGAGTSTPPNNTGGNTMTKEQIRAIKDPGARQRAMLENPSLFGLG